MAFVYWIHLKEHTDILTEGYVGITSRTVKERLKQHKQAGKSKRSKRGIAKVFNVLSDKLIVTTICECSIEYAGELEFKLRPNENIGWNLAAGGNTVSMTEEGRKRVSLAMKGVPKPQHVLDAMNNAMLAKPVSDESRRKWSAWATGRVNSPETRLKISQGRKGKSPPRARSSTEAAIATFASKHPLDLPNQNKTVWLLCDLYYEEYLKGHTRFVASQRVGGSKGSLVAMWKRFALGFNPLVDERWLEWKASTVHTVRNIEPEDNYQE